MMHSSPHSGGDQKESSAIAGSAAGLADTLITLVAAIMSNSSVILADMLKTFLEFVAVFFSWLAIRSINRGRHKNFDYGFHKLENISGLFISFFMLACLLIITISASRSIMHPAEISGIGIWISYFAQILYGVINTFLYLRYRKMARLSVSPLCESQAKLFFTKAFGNVFIFISLNLSMLLGDFSWAHYIDPAASIIIALTILLSAFGIFKNSFCDLLDKTLEESDQIVILRELARHFDEYEGIHGIRSRRAGSQAFIEILLEFSPEKTVAQAGEVIDSIRTAIESKISGAKVTIGLSDRPESK